jgi:hypothetical protein
MTGGHSWLTPQRKEVTTMINSETATGKREYLEPTFTVIGRITALTGMFRNGNYLDNSNGSDAWKTVGGGS